MRLFLNVYPDLVLSVKHCVMTVADHCYSIGLISPDMYDQLLQRLNWIDVEKTRNLLSSIRTVLSTRPTALKEFVTVFLKWTIVDKWQIKYSNSFSKYSYYCSI